MKKSAVKKRGAAGRPRKAPDEKYVRFFVYLSPAAEEALARLMQEDAADNRSGAIAALIIAEDRRRARQRAKKAT